MLCDDIIRIRIAYLVMAAASAWSSAVSKELYDEALRHLAPLGTSTDSSSLVPGRMIRLDNTHNTHTDIYQMSRLAEEKGTSMNNVRLHYYVAIKSQRRFRCIMLESRLCALTFRILYCLSRVFGL
jgi:hypothetical protein